MMGKFKLLVCLLFYFKNEILLIEIIELNFVILYGLFRSIIIYTKSLTSFLITNILLVNNRKFNILSRLNVKLNIYRN